MKKTDPKDATVLIIDSGMFLPFALRLAKEFGRVLYWNPVEQASPRIQEAKIGDGFDEITRLNSPWSVIDEVDVFAFPDCIQPAFQEWLEERGKSVWGARMGVYLEWDREIFRDHMQDLNLPVHPYHMARGLSELTDYLKDKENQYVRISRYRGNGETWHWIDAELSGSRLDELAIEYGPVQEDIDFLVESAFEAKEVGYDGWFYGGRFPSSAFHGIERKDKSYFGALCDYTDLPKPLKTVTDAIAPLLARLGYANNFHAEVRVTPDGTPYFTDPTCRHASPAGEPLLEACTNLGDIVLAGAQGEYVEPEWESKFVAQVLIDHKDDGKEHWRTVRVPDLRWIKLYNACKVGKDLYGIPPLMNSCSVIGSVLGQGDTPEEAVESLKEHAAMLDGQDVTVDTAALASAIAESDSDEPGSVEMGGQNAEEAIELAQGED